MTSTEETSLVTARSSSISFSASDSSNSVDVDAKKTPRESDGAAGDSVRRNPNNGNTNDNSPPSRQGTTRRRRRGALVRRPKDLAGTPQAPPKRQLGNSGVRGYGSYMPLPGYGPKHDDPFSFDDIDMLLYCVKELCAVVEAERFLCSPTFMNQFQLISQRMLLIARSLSQRCRQTYSPPLVKSSLYDSLLRVRSPELLNGALDRVRDPLSPHDDGPVLPSGERVLKRAKVMVPEHPNYNFIGRILGPRGISVRQLEASSGCGILIRGKGSVKNAEREERLRSRNTPGFEHLKEPLHVLITAEGVDEAECDAKLEKCKRRIEKLLKPEYDEYKRRQLAHLAMINGNYDATRGISPAL